MQYLSFETLLGIGSVIFAMAYAWERLRSGGKQADSDLITSLTNNLKAQKEINDSMTDQQTKMQAQILELTQQVGKLQGINQANDQKMKEYLQIIANRNPELEQTLVSIEELIRDVVPFMAEVRKWHMDLKSQVNGIDARIKPNKKKEAV